MAATISHPRSSVRSGDPLGLVRVHDRFAIGESASLHLGWLVRTRRLVTVKRLHPHHAADELRSARVLAAARRAMRVDHPNVVATLGIMRKPRELAVVTEYEPSATLAEAFAAGGGRVPPRVAVAIAADALRGIDATRGCRAGHVWPGTVLVGEDGRVRLADVDTACWGELPYAAPERLLRRPSDPRSDVWSVAVLLWEMLTGQQLFHGANAAAVVAAIHSAPIPAPGFGAALDAIVLRGLERSPDDRFASAPSMANALDRLLHAPPEEVGDWLRSLSLPGLLRRRAIAELVQVREEGARSDLHSECTGVTPRI